MIDISEASIDDAEEISALATRTYVHAFGAEFEPDELSWHLERTISAQRWIEYLHDDRVLWAKIAGRPIGFVQFGPRETPGEVTIDRLYVEAEFQGQGIGSRLLQQVLSEPDVVAATAVTIDVWQDNPGAHRLYERFGFRHEGGQVPFISKSGKIEGYDLILVRRASRLTI